MTKDREGGTGREERRETVTGKGEYMEWDGERERGMDGGKGRNNKKL